MGVKQMHTEEARKKGQINRRRNDDDHYIYSLAEVAYQTIIDVYENAESVDTIDQLEDDVSALIMDWGEIR